MERLTSRTKYITGRRLKKSWEATTMNGAEAIYEASNRLAEYEDTGMTPEEIKETKCTSIIIPENKKMSEEQKLYFLYGALYSQAKDMKKDGCFNDLDLNDIVKLLIEEIGKSK